MARQMKMMLLALAALPMLLTSCEYEMISDIGLEELKPNVLLPLVADTLSVAEVIARSNSSHAIQADDEGNLYVEYKKYIPEKTYGMSDIMVIELDADARSLFVNDTVEMTEPGGGTSHAVNHRPKNCEMNTPFGPHIYNLSSVTLKEYTVSAMAVGDIGDVGRLEVRGTFILDEERIQFSIPLIPDDDNKRATVLRTHESGRTPSPWEIDLKNEGNEVEFGIDSLRIVADENVEADVSDRLERLVFQISDIVYGEIQGAGASEDVTTSMDLTGYQKDEISKIELPLFKEVYGADLDFEGVEASIKVYGGGDNAKVTGLNLKSSYVDKDEETSPELKGLYAKGTRIDSLGSVLELTSGPPLRESGYSGRSFDCSDKLKEILKKAPGSITLAKGTVEGLEVKANEIPKKLGVELHVRIPFKAKVQQAYMRRELAIDPSAFDLDLTEYIRDEGEDTVVQLRINFDNQLGVELATSIKIVGIDAEGKDFVWASGDQSLEFDTKPDGKTIAQDGAYYQFLPKGESSIVIDLSLPQYRKLAKEAKKLRMYFKVPFTDGVVVTLTKDSKLSVSANAVIKAKYPDEAAGDH